MTIRLLGTAQTRQLAKATGSATIPGLMQTQLLIQWGDPLPAPLAEQTLTVDTDLSNRAGQRDRHPPTPYQLAVGI